MDPILRMTEMTKESCEFGPMTQAFINSPDSSLASVCLSLVHSMFFKWFDFVLVFKNSLVGLRITSARLGFLRRNVAIFLLEGS